MNLSGHICLFFGGEGMTLGPKPIHRRIAQDIGDMEFPRNDNASAQRVLWLSGMTSAVVILLAATSVLHFTPPRDAAQEIAAAAPAAQQQPSAGQSDQAVTASLPAKIDETVTQVLAEAPACATELNALARLSTIYFDADSDLLDSNDLMAARQVAEALKMCPGMTLQVWGHADGSGSDADNLALSEKRAQNTLVALRAMGFDTATFQAHAAGASLPKAQGDTDEALDRRVEFRVIPIPQN